MKEILDAEFGADLYEYTPSYEEKGTVVDCITGRAYVVWVEPDGDFIKLVVNPF